jgi:D-alanyl-D-alanine carboxypeptidase
MVDTTAKELLVPGAVLLLRTPQGEFTVTYGTTQLGTTSPPRADTHFRIASNTKSMTAAVIVQLAQEGKLSLDDPVSKYVPRRAQWRQHHDRRTAEDAQRPLQLH